MSKNLDFREFVIRFAPRNVSSECAQNVQLGEQALYMKTESNPADDAEVHVITYCAGEY
jgi:hypothetical protein